MASKESQLSRRSAGSRDKARDQTRSKHASKDSLGSRVSSTGSQSYGTSITDQSEDSGSRSPKYGRSRYTTKDTTGTGASYSSGSYSAGSGSDDQRRKKKKGKGGRNSDRKRTRSRSRSTRGSHSRTGSSSKSGSSDSWSSSSSEDLMDQDLSLVDQSILPLHMREGAICSKEEAYLRQNKKLDRRKSVQSIDGTEFEEDEEEEEEEDFAWVDNRTKYQIALSRFLGHETAGKHVERDVIMMDHWQLAIRIYPCAAWSVVAVCLLFLFLARYYITVEQEGQRLVVLKLMSRTEVSIAASIAPAFRMVSSLAFATRAGVLNRSMPYDSLANILAPEFIAGPAVEFIQIAGAGDYTTLLRPGNISAWKLPPRDRQLLVFAADKRCGSLKKDPMLCLTQLHNKALLDSPRDAAAYRWQRPSFIHYDGSVPHWIYPEERIDPAIDAYNLTAYAHRLVAFIDATSTTWQTGAKGPRLAVEVAIDLSKVFDDVSAGSPPGGETFLCTSDGTVIAGSSWRAEAAEMYDPEQGMMVYPRLWDLGLDWTSTITTEMLAAGKQAEGWSGSDLVVSRPMAVGDPAGASYRAGLADLRLVSTAPRTVGTSKDFKGLVLGAMGVMGAPPIFLFLWLLGVAIYGLVMKIANCLFERSMKTSQH